MISESKLKPMFLCMEGTSGSLLFALPKTMLQLIFQKPASALFCWCKTHSEGNYGWKSSIWRLMIANRNQKSHPKSSKLCQQGLTSLEQMLQNEVSNTRQEPFVKFLRQISSSSFKEKYILKYNQVISFITSLLVQTNIHI